MIWSKSGNQGDQWIQGQISLGSSNSPFQIMFEGVVGTGFTGDIAIDDVSFSDQSCTSPGL